MEAVEVLVRTIINSSARVLVSVERKCGVPEKPGLGGAPERTPLNMVVDILLRVFVAPPSTVLISVVKKVSVSGCADMEGPVRCALPTSMVKEFICPLGTVLPMTTPAIDVDVKKALFEVLGAPGGVPDWLAVMPERESDGKVGLIHVKNVVETLLLIIVVLEDTT